MCVSFRLNHQNSKTSISLKCHGLTLEQPLIMCQFRLNNHNSKKNTSCHPLKCHGLMLNWPLINILVFCLFASLFPGLIFDIAEAYKRLGLTII